MPNKTAALSGVHTEKYSIPAYALQRTATPTATAVITPATSISATSGYSFTLAEQDYKEVALLSPYGNTQYTFRIPEHWLISQDGVFNLDFSYLYTPIVEDTSLVYFGSLTVKLDGHELDALSLTASQLNQQQWQISLPQTLLAHSENHVIEIEFTDSQLCGVPHQARLTIHPTASIFLNYTETPTTPDLSRYPKPFYQRSFETDRVYFVLPRHSSSNDLTSAVAVAAKLGDLTGNRIVISATTDIELDKDLKNTSAKLEENLIVVGQPQHNQFFSLLNGLTTLPVALRSRKLEFTTQGPASIAPEDSVAYVFTVTNTITQSVNLFLSDSLPPYTEFVDCTPHCSVDAAENLVVWRNNRLATGATAVFSLSLRASPVLTGAVLENTVTLTGTGLGAINADTLTAAVTAKSAEKTLSVAHLQAGSYFFVMQNSGLVVPKDDGVIQEIVSPWNSAKAILIISGLNDQALEKAALAMSSELHFPGMSGDAALVQKALPPEKYSKADSAALEKTFKSLGYSDAIMLAGAQQEERYYFYVPFGWNLSSEAFVEIYFNHSQLLKYDASELKILLNNRLLGSVALSSDTALDGHIRINLKDANIRAGDVNRLSLQAELTSPNLCSVDKAWLQIKDSSKIYLSHTQTAIPNFDLDYYPYPFSEDQTLSSVLIVTPDSPTAGEIEQSLRVAAQLGNAVTGDSLAPTAITGNAILAEDLENNNIIVVGRHTRNGLLQQVNPHLPQPFLPDSDQIKQQIDNVVLRLPENVNLGYLQLAHSPWNESYGLLAVTGTTDKAIDYAVNVLVNKPWLLDGNLLIVSENDVRSMDTRKLTTKGTDAETRAAVSALVQTEMSTSTAVASATTAITATPTLLPSPATTGQAPQKTPKSAWLIPFVVFMGIIVIAIPILAFWKSRRRVAKM